ncbi:hypothetical protein, partial [Rhodanobacter sp. 115]|uniref:hypothetical protein n=1 Tax=Rhodanobacter sp. FW021-MT20 TaxID=1162282 RepID=UPI001ED92035
MGREFVPGSWPSIALPCTTTGSTSRHGFIPEPWLLLKRTLGGIEDPLSPQRLSTAEGLVKLGSSAVHPLKSKGAGFLLSHT